MQFELDLIHWMQSWGIPFWKDFFNLWTMFGEEAILIALMGFVYWCYHKKMGEYLGLTVFLSQIVNSVVKLGFQRPRPFVADATVANLRGETATGFSFPSGHTQGAATVFAATSLRVKKRWLTIVSSVIIGMVALSRMYLGAHYLTDVLVAAVLGIGIAWGMDRLTRGTGDLRKRYDVILIGSLVLMVIMLVVGRLTIGEMGDLTDAGNFYDKLEGLVKMTAAFLGFVLGIRFEERRVNFVNHRVWWKNIVRLVLGLVLLLGLKEGLKAVFQLIVPTGDGDLGTGDYLQAFFGLGFDFIRYSAMVFAGIGLYPLVFKKFNL
ncbi:MAG TPA: phosphatase PAP2 family protein [Candidatus Izemoplasmatales bacterium]|nr:phosphatase PAP2 family protein [Candidatus Izemoplasmatales bacterium]